MDNQDEKEQQAANKIPIDWRALAFKKSWILLILIPLVITFMVRLEPMKLKPLENSAEASVMNYYRSSIMAEIEKQFPNLPQDQKAGITEEKFNEFLQQNKEQVNSQIEQNAAAIKSRLQYNSGDKVYAYLGDIDSYYWLRQSRNIIEKGTQCDAIKDGICYDSYTLAPNLNEKQIDYYPIVIAGIYKILKVFQKDMSLMQASFLTPLVFSLVFTIPLFLLMRRMSGNISAIIATILVNMNPNVLARSLGSDNDISNIFFQIFFIWIAVSCFYSGSLKGKGIWASLAGMILSIYSLFWGGWWYLADLFILALIVKLSYKVIEKWYTNKKLVFAEFKEPLKEFAFSAVPFVLVIVVLYGFVLFSPTALLSLVTSQFEVLKFKVAANPNYWPNVLTTVAEFNSIGVSSVVSSFGSFVGISMFLMATLGTLFLVFPTTRFINKSKIAFLLFIITDLIIYNIIKSSSGILVFLLMIPVIVGILLHIRLKEKETFHPDVVFLLTMIICMVTYFSTTGARFLFLMAVPVSIFAAIFFERTARLFLSIIKNIFSLHKYSVSIGIVLLALWLLIVPVKTGFATAQSYLPSVSDEWVETLEKIKESSKPDAIINSWWDFGHWFKYLADRRVTLDGSSQNNPQLHWLGKLLLTSNETVSVGILRMLDCGGNNAFNEINAKMNDTPHSIDILNRIIVEKKEKAAKILAEHGFSSEETQKVLQYTHCDPPENFLITSEDMIGKGGVWAHFGSWDFKKAYLSIIYKTIPESEIIRKFSEDYEIPESTTNSWLQELNSFDNDGQVNSWIASWPSFYSGFSGCENKDNITTCLFSRDNNQIPTIVDFKNKEAYTQVGDKKIPPAAAAFVEDNSFELVRASGENTGLGVAVIKRGDSVEAMYMDPALAGSMFTRLFFFEGIGLSSFEKFYDTRTVFGGRIITWKVRWDSGQTQ